MTRNPFFAKSSFCFKILLRSISDKISLYPSTKILLQRCNKTSGAPLVYKWFLELTLINLRVESNGNSNCLLAINLKGCLIV